MLDFTWLHFTFVFAIKAGLVNAETLVTVNASETAVLICPKSTDLSITFWTGPPGFTTYNFPGSTNIERIDATRLEINETNAALLIHNVTLEDEGLYRCSATGHGEADVWLEVTNIPPTLINVINTINQDNKEIVYGTEDKYLSLVCSAKGGKPEPKITWSRSDFNETIASSDSVTENEDGAFDVTSSRTVLTNRSVDGVVFTCTVYHPALQSPVKKNVQVYLNLKPQFDNYQGEILTTEGIEATINCTVFGARPAANVTLYFDGKRVDDNITAHNNSSDTYTTEAKLTRNMNKTENGMTVSCIVSHVTFETPINRTLTIVVQYPPAVSIYSQNTTSHSDKISIECLASGGNPNNYTFLPWKHVWSSQNGILREIVSTRVDENKAILKLEGPTFQDSGMYTCLISNGVGSSGSPAFVTEKKVFLLVKDVPIVVDGHSKYYSAVDETVDILIDVYTNVEQLDVSVERTKATENSSAIWTILDPVSKTVGIPVYNQEISISGSRIAVHFEVQASDNYGPYRIVLYNGVGSTFHSFTVLSREKSITDVPVDGNEINVVETLVPICACVVLVGVIVAVYRLKKHREERKERLNPKRPKTDQSGGVYTKTQPTDIHSAEHLYEDVKEEGSEARPPVVTISEQDEKHPAETKVTLQQEKTKQSHSTKPRVKRAKHLKRKRRKEKFYINESV